MIIHTRVDITTIPSRFQSLSVVLGRTIDATGNGYACFAILNATKGSDPSLNPSFAKLLLLVRD
jgi:hypothetical protein